MINISQAVGLNIVASSHQRKPFISTLQSKTWEGLDFHTNDCMWQGLRYFLLIIYARFKKLSINVEQYLQKLNISKSVLRFFPIFSECFHMWLEWSSRLFFFLLNQETTKPKVKKVKRLTVFQKWLTTWS